MIWVKDIREGITNMNVTGKVYILEIFLSSLKSGEKLVFLKTSPLAPPLFHCTISITPFHFTTPLQYCLFAF